MQTLCAISCDIALEDFERRESEEDDGREETAEGQKSIGVSHLTAYRALHPKVAAMVTGRGGRDWFDHEEANREMVLVMERFGLKQEMGVPAMCSYSANTTFFPQAEDVGHHTQADKGAAVGGGGAAPARIDNPHTPCLGGSFPCFGAPTPSLQAMCVNGAMVRVSLTWFQRESDFFRAMQKGERENGGSSERPVVATRADGDECGYLFQYKPPSTVKLPPRIPPPRDGHATLAAGIVEQYERFIVVDGACYSPIRFWEDRARPPGIKPDSLLNRFI
eukprot:scaffold267073_cov34-Attheya_sp.AAC.1